MKIFLFLLIVIIMLVSFALIKGGDIFLFILSFSMIPIIVAAYRYGIVWAYLISAIVTAFCIGLIKLGIKTPPMLLSIISFNMLPLIVLKFNNILGNYRQGCKAKIVNAENNYQRLFEEDGQIKKFNAQLERDVLEMARLYEITKAMSRSLEFADIFRVLKSTLEKTFKFSAAKLILIFQKAGQDLPIIEKSYRIQPADRSEAFEEKKLIKLGTSATSFLDAGAVNNLNFEIDAAQLSESDRKTVEIFSFADRKPLISKPGGLNAGANVAAGLVSENAPVGILSIESLGEDQIDRFLIVASQFELELQKVKLYERVQQLAIMDGLTGLFVRRYLLERCQDELRRSIKHKLNLSCLLVDIDFFKDTNDRYGHLVGDVVLKGIAAIIKENIREVDFAGRLGGEEFCVILPDTPKAGAVHVAERLRKAVQGHIFTAYDESVKVTVSIGASIFPDDASDPNQLIDYADQAMYRAKAEGRNKVCAWN